MDPAYIVAFVRSLQDVSSTMLDLDVEVGSPRIHSDADPENDVSAIISLSGDCVGSVALRFTTKTAAAMVSKFAGTDIDPESPDFTDAVGELANMIIGGAKSKFSGDMNISISCPSVIVGPGHRVFQQKDIPVIEIPAESACGPIRLVVSIRPADQTAARSAG